MHTLKTLFNGSRTLDITPLLHCWRRDEVTAVIVTSSEGLRNWCDMVGAAGLACLRNTLIVVPHPRIATAARALGMKQVAESASGDEALLQTVIHHLSG